jgi:hypothetical protein
LPFDSTGYGSFVAEILALDQDGNRLIPLVSGGCSSKEARAVLVKQKPLDLFPAAQAPEAALAGLWLYFSASDECHQIVQDLRSAESSFWHAILHRQEPDAGNASYWFRRVGSHPIFAELRGRAEEIAARYAKAGFRPGPKWDPLAFVEFCGQARREPGSRAERAALEIQSAEWQLLFDYCARSRS